MKTVLKPMNAAEATANSVNGSSDSVPSLQPLGLNAERVVAKRYSLKDGNGEPLETWDDVVRRVVGHVSQVETDPSARATFYSEMTGIMLGRQFVPNTPCLVNAGKPNGQLAACFVLNVPDSIQGIMKHAESVAIIHQTGGGTRLGGGRIGLSSIGAAND